MRYIFCGTDVSTWHLYAKVKTLFTKIVYEPRHEISNNVVCATSIRAVWSEPFLVAWILLKFQATNQTSSGISMLKRRLHRLVWVHTRRNATLLEITCCGSYIVVRCMYIFTDYFTNVSIESNQTAPTGAVRCGSKLNVINGLKRNLEQFGN